MDDDTAEFTTLRTRLGMIMEEAGVITLTIDAGNETDSVETLAQLDEAAQSIGDLARAARSIQLILLLTCQSWSLIV